MSTLRRFGLKADATDSNRIYHEFAEQIKNYIKKIDSAVGLLEINAALSDKKLILYNLDRAVANKTLTTEQYQRLMNLFKRGR